MKIHASCDKFEVFSWIYEVQCVAKVVTDGPSKKIFFCLTVGKTSKKCLLCFHKKLAVITHPSQNILQKKNQKFYPNADMRTIMYSRISTHTHYTSTLPTLPPLLKFPPQISPQHTISTIKSNIFISMHFQNLLTLC